jgi:hypothetical protein
MIWTLRGPIGRGADLALCAYQCRTGRLVSTIAVSIPDWMQLDHLPSLAVRNGSAYILVGQRVIHIDERHHQHEILLDAVGQSLIPSNPFVRTRLVIPFDQGGTVLWPSEKASATFGQDLIDPTAGFAQDGSLVVAGRTRGLVLRTENNNILHRANFDLPNVSPLAVVPAGEPHTFAIFYPDGLVQVMSLPRE